jgi:hypothetical protein
LTGIFANNASAQRPTKLLNKKHHDIVDEIVLDNDVDTVVYMVVSVATVVVCMLIIVVQIVIRLLLMY